MLACATIAAMRAAGLAAAWLFLLATPVLGQTADPLVRARTLYNARDYDGAIAAADEGRELPGRVDDADLIAARAYLERHRQSAAEEDLASARARLRRINPHSLDARERAEYVVGLGSALYFEDLPGAAAAVFASLVDDRESLDPAARDRLLDWWASALDRDARPRPGAERRAAYRQVRDRMRAELAANPASPVAAYWLAAAAAGEGDWQGAWDEAQAGWVRAALTPDRGAVLLADLDRLVQRAIAPERARAMAQPPELLLDEWSAFKARWARN
jgi:hypothetical protein